MMSGIRSFAHRLLNVLYPPRCVACEAPHTFLCSACRAEFYYLTPPWCRKCGYPKVSENATCIQCQSHPFQALNLIRSVAFFEVGPLQKAIHRFKYQNLQAVKDDFAALMATCYKQNQDQTDIRADVIVPVPLHPSRQKMRGYNQSDLLAQSLGVQLHLPVDNKTLRRVRKTATQAQLSLTQRKHNVAQAFQCLSQQLAGYRILLIDDVCTTGATLDACAQALKDARAEAVYGLTLARAQ